MTWDKVKSTGFNFCCVTVPARKAQLQKDRYKYSPKTVFFALTEFRSSIYISPSGMCLFTGNSVKQQKLCSVLGILPHVNVFCNKRVIWKNTDCLTHNCRQKHTCDISQFWRELLIWSLFSTPSQETKTLDDRFFQCHFSQTVFLSEHIII